jgi:hypothetical protein
MRPPRPPASEALPLCARITSSDGRYRAPNPYLAPPPFPPTPCLDIRSKYQHQLTDYGGEDIIIRVADSGVCHEDAEGMTRPILYSGDSTATDGAARLRASVNSGSPRATLELLDATGQSLGTTKCDKPRNRAANLCGFLF